MELNLNQEYQQQAQQSQQDFIELNQISDQDLQQELITRQRQNQGQPQKTIMDNDDFLKWLVNFRKNIIEPQRYIWLGYELDENGKWIAPELNDTSIVPKMNRRGVNWLITFIGNYLNPAFIISNYNEMFMNHNMRGIVHVLAKKLSVSYIEFAIKKDDIPSIIMTTEHIIQSIFLGARDNGFRNFFTSTTQRQEVINKSNEYRPNIWERMWGR